MDLYEFLEEIGQNNNRVWFADNKHIYDELREKWLTDLQRLIDCMTEWLPEMGRIKAKDATYRFYRDTRFSPDKSPFKIFFSAALTPYGKKSPLAGYYLQVDPRADENGLYAGLWCPDANMLRKMRHAIVDNIEEFEEILDTPDIKRYWARWAGEQLRTAPKGWPKDHPQIELLRLKDYGRYNQCDRDFFRNPDWPEIASDRFRMVSPFVNFINYSLLE